MYEETGEGNRSKGNAREGLREGNTETVLELRLDVQTNAAPI